MKTLLITHKNPSLYGGYEKLALALSTALDTDIYNTHSKIGYDPDDYDYFIAMDDLSARKLPLERPHTLYMTTPRRSFYDMYYFSPHYLRPLIWMGRVLDRHFIKNSVKDIVGISHCIRNRIYKTYQRDASVIYPCINCSDYYYGGENNYWLSVQRISKWKRIEMITEAFSKMPDENLILFGACGDTGDVSLVKDLPDNVIWETGNDRYLRDRYSLCKGVISMGIDEDFGIVPLEAMASGKWVIAPYEGGYMETLDSDCGTLICPTANDLATAVKEYKRPAFAAWYSQERARQFDYSVFKRQWVKHAKFIYEECV